MRQNVFAAGAPPDPAGGAYSAPLAGFRGEEWEGRRREGKGKEGKGRRGKVNGRGGEVKPPEQKFWIYGHGHTRNYMHYYFPK